MKKILAGLLVLLCVLSLMGCKEQGSVETLEDGGKSESKSAVAGWDLTGKGDCHLQENLSADEIVLDVEDSFYTNSTEITVKNNGDASLTVYLYNENDRGNVALQMTLKEGETKSFSNLTSRYLYYLCFEPATLGAAIDVIISD